MPLRAPSRMPSGPLGQLLQLLPEEGPRREELATILNVDEALLGSWLEGRFPAPPEALVALADAVGLPRLPVLEEAAQDYLWRLMRAYVTATILDGTGARQ